MRKFYCFGKKDFCDHNSDCVGCPHNDDSGGVYREAPITNADRIRSMTDEELAKKIIVLQQSAIAFVCESLGYSAPSPEEINGGDLKGTLGWLKQPYKEDT